MGVGWFNDNHTFKVDFDFINGEGKIVHTDLSNNDAGYSLTDALDIQRQLKWRENTYNITIVQIKEGLK